MIQSNNNVEFNDQANDIPNFEEIKHEIYEKSKDESKPMRKPASFGRG
jgi:hypothetical protein